MMPCHGKPNATGRSSGKLSGKECSLPGEASDAHSMM